MKGLRHCEGMRGVSVICCRVTNRSKASWLKTTIIIGFALESAISEGLGRGGSSLLYAAVAGPAQVEAGGFTFKMATHMAGNLGPAVSLAGVGDQGAQCLSMVGLSI